MGIPAVFTMSTQQRRRTMQTIGRRDFVKTMVIGGAVLTLDAVLTVPHLSAAPKDLKAIGECKKVSIRCISEIGWWDNKVLVSDLKKAGGPKDADQWISEWTPSNAAGSCSLVEVEGLDGSKTRFLIDTGWDPTYMDERFKAEGIDRMLKNGEIDFLYITHEHLDHFWGLETTLKYNPEIKILIPSTFRPPALKLIEGADFPKSNVKNEIHHKGQLIKLQVGEATKLMDGVVSVGFDVPIILKIRGEQSLYFNVKDKGLVLCTGCCHQNVLTLADYAVNNLNGQHKLHGLYGGLHIAPFGQLGDQERSWIEKMGAYGFTRIAANHCTGLPAVQKMVELGYPVIKGTGSKGSQSDLYIGNGDSVVFG
jgi:7,8-dihydropterin-6-yl-methyl-4-(beta-D-ribofuranosyl)aminobenzene 5'-phosphate synthase